MKTYPPGLTMRLSQEELRRIGWLAGVHGRSHGQVVRADLNLHFRAATTEKRS